MNRPAPEVDSPAGAAEDAGARRRPIRSFVLRTGRTTPAQQRAFDAHWARYGLDYTGTPRDFDAAFGRRAPRVVEIGFGNGEALLFAAAADPDRDYVGIEVHTPGVGRLLNALATQAIGNVRVYRHDAVEVLREEIAPGSLDEVRIYFPDPWHKKRHHKRRLVQPAFLALLASRLRTGGRLHLATDWAPYAEHMLDVLEASPHFDNPLAPRTTVERPPWRPPTRFEARGLKLGHAVADLVYLRNAVA